MKHRLFSVCILSALLSALILVQPASAIAGGWTATGPMNSPRYRHTATLLSNGLVLVAGGYNTSALASAELYVPSTGVWVPTGSLAVARQIHTATLLPDGKVLVTGGYDTAFKVLASAELYDPATGLWTGTDSMSVGRVGHSATLLANGKVLVAGGSGPLASAALYDPATNTWTSTGSMNVARAFHTAVRLLSGKVLVMGGLASRSLVSAELYDPGTGQWTSTAALGTDRYSHTATLLSNGKVLVVGGWNDSHIFLTSAEVYDPAAGAWSATGSLATGREIHTATLLPNGKVLISGGWNNTRGGYLSSAELYDPGSGTWTATSSLATARDTHASVLLPNGKVLAVGGSGATGTLTSAELYTSTQVVILKSGGPQDGWVLETSETSNQGGLTNATATTFVLGDNAGNRQFRAILGFNTAPLPDNAVITRVVLRIKKQGVTGTNPFTTHMKIAVDIRRGPFSNALALQPADFQAIASKPAVGFITNKPMAGGWYLAGINATAYPYINRTGVTQFRLRFQLDDDNDRVADFLRFYSGNAIAANRPILVLEYYVP